MEAEIAGAKSFLRTRSYRILEGGPKRDVPHVVVPYPDAARDSWTIFFAKDTLEPHSIERKGTEGKRYLIQLDPRSGLLINFSSATVSLGCDPPGILRGFAVPIRDKFEYTLIWSVGSHHLETEAVYDWAKRGKVITK
ncbi:MAG: hypothetical protein PHW60_15845 [Kiritimatiellae bacterium]|nr:hypothetical protein [Kiritimatiellia bacterium]